jgi:hypothetical protein
MHFQEYQFYFYALLCKPDYFYALCCKPDFLLVLCTSKNMIFFCVLLLILTSRIVMHFYALLNLNISLLPRYPESCAYVWFCRNLVENYPIYMQYVFGRVVDLSGSLTCMAHQPRSCHHFSMVQLLWRSSHFFSYISKKWERKQISQTVAQLVFFLHIVPYMLRLFSIMSWATILNFHALICAELIQSGIPQLANFLCSFLQVATWPAPWPPWPKFVCYTSSVHICKVSCCTCFMTELAQIRH